MRLVLLAAEVGGLSTAEDQLIIYIIHKWRVKSAFNSRSELRDVCCIERAFMYQQQINRLYSSRENKFLHTE